MRVVTRGHDDHRDDPAIREILASGAPIDVITVAPAREILFAQFLKRVRSDEYDEPWETRTGRGASSEACAACA